jgi:hypothetical protein
MHARRPGLEKGVTPSAQIAGYHARWRASVSSGSRRGTRTRASCLRFAAMCRSRTGARGRKLERQPGGDRQVVEILGAVLTDGLEAVEAACSEALAHNVHSAGVVLNILARRREPPPPLTITTPDALKLGREPAANCDRYDSLRRTANGTITGAGRHGSAEALRHEDGLRRDHRHGGEATARTPTDHRRFADRRDQ